MLPGLRATRQRPRPASSFLTLAGYLGFHCDADGDADTSRGLCPADAAPASARGVTAEDVGVRPHEPGVRKIGQAGAADLDAAVAWRGVEGHVREHAAMTAAT